MTAPTGAEARRRPLRERFAFRGGAVCGGDQAALQAAVFDVEDGETGAERTLKLWRKTGRPVNQDLRQLWLHEARQVQRVMSYAGAREVIVDVLEFVEDDEHFGVVLERVGRPLSMQLEAVPRQHWFNNLGAPRARRLLWQNIRRLVRALGIVHAQGLVHGHLNADTIMTDASDEPDFHLGGFEWSLWLGAAQPNRTHAKLGLQGAKRRADSYSFARDWRALGLLVARTLRVDVKRSGDVVAAAGAEGDVILGTAERVLLKRLVTPSRLDSVDATSIASAIDDVLNGIARSVSIRAGSFILMFLERSKLADVVYTASEGDVAIDDRRAQLDWARADLDGGVTLLVPPAFDPATGRLRLVTESLVYDVSAFRDGGTAVWDVAVCTHVAMRTEALRWPEDNEHAVAQPIVVANGHQDAREIRARSGPDVLDWSAFASGRSEEVPRRSSLVRRALLLVQAVEALVKALEIYPIEALRVERREGHLYTLVRAQPQNDRDALAVRVGLPETSVALRRLFEEEHRDGDVPWRISTANSLGAARARDVAARFVDVEERGSVTYEFEIDEELPERGPYFLKPDRDVGTEQVIRRRLRNIAELDARVDLAEMLDDPWRVRRTSRDALQNDAQLRELDVPKQGALRGLWSTLPVFLVVGPPGVGKTMLAAEVLRRRFVFDRATRMLLSAQGHDALENLQAQVRKTLHENGMTDVIVVRSTTPDRRTTSDEEVHRAAHRYLSSLASSELAREAPAPLRARIEALAGAAGRAENKTATDREERSALRAFSNVVLDGANVVISTANSQDIERLVDAREQFDWVVVEEAAKATGPEIIGPLMLSGRRLLIGDHHQLPPFDAERLVKILSDHGLVEHALSLLDPLVGPLLREGELDELVAMSADAETLRATSQLALRLLEPFRTFVEEDERRELERAGSRPISATLTEQRRMDPAIAEVVSHSFYKEKLKTESGRAERAETDEPPFVHAPSLPTSPIVVVDFPHVSTTGRGRPAELGKPRWHNPAEVDSVVDVLRHVRALTSTVKPTLAVLSPYAAQVDKLRDRIHSLRKGELAHLAGFAPARPGMDLIGTVDSFQGSEADLVVISLVRNNPRTGRGALGFLRDRRRMNVLLSRAKSQLVLVGSLAFLREAVRGVDPRGEGEDLAFLTKMVTTIERLSHETRRDHTPLAALVSPDALRGRG